MAELSSVISAIRRKSPEDEPADVVGAFAGFGSILGIVAAVIGLLAGISLVPITSFSWEVVPITPETGFWIFGGNELYPIYTGLFMALIAASLFLQAWGSKDLRARLGGMFGSVFYVGFITAAAVAIYAFYGFAGVEYESQISNFISILYLITVFFVICWQMVSVFYVDSSLSWTGFSAGIMNGLFIPLLALGQVFGSLLTYAAYGVLIVGQLMALLYWWSSKKTIRPFARSPDKAKFAFGIIGVLTFVIGSAAVFVGPLATHYTGAAIWYPWSTLVTLPAGTAGIHYLTNPALLYGFLSMMLLWILLSPRLGARELKTTTIGDDIIKGGSKWFAVFMIFMGILAAGQAGVFSEDPGGWGFFMVIGPAAAMILIGAMYTAKTDIVTGMPLIVAGIFTMVHPFTIAYLVTIPWIAIIITQIFLMIESKWRGLTGFSQGALAVLVSIVASIALIGFMLGLFGRGPLALWPTNLWFNISLFPVDPAVQTSVIIILPFLALLIRNAALAGFSHGRGYSTGGILMGATVLFSLMIPIIAGNTTVPHEASTGAAILIGLYAISMFLVLSLNLKLSNDVIEQGHDLEGNLIKFSSVGQVIMGVIMFMLVLIFFSGLPSSTEIAFVISFMVIFLVGSELLSIVSWFIAGVRLGLLKEGFRIQRPAQ
jgi:hypothetical protein